MKLIQTTINKTFKVSISNKLYYVNYLNSNGQILGLMNRSNWEVSDKNGEEINIYSISNDTAKEKSKISKKRKLMEKLINFCIKHFND